MWVSSSSAGKRTGLILAATLAFVFFLPFFAPVESALAAVGEPIKVPSSLAVRKPLLPPPRGIAELRFRDIYRNPIGPRGLELSEQVLALDGKRVRIVGFMVAQEPSTPGVFMFAPVPSAISEDDEGLADDLPPSTLFVHLPLASELIVPNLPGLIQLSGTLSVGARSEAISGRVSSIRLLLDKGPTRSLRKLSRRYAR